MSYGRRIIGLPFKRLHNCPGRGLRYKFYVINIVKVDLCVTQIVESSKFCCCCCYSFGIARGSGPQANLALLEPPPPNSTS